jgi:hypothetical protein
MAVAAFKGIVLCLEEAEAILRSMAAALVHDDDPYGWGSFIATAVIAHGMKVGKVVTRQKAHIIAMKLAVCITEKRA